MTITERFLEATKDIYEEYYNHPFITGVRDGTLSKEQYKYYFIQDTLYLAEYAKVFLIGAAKYCDMDTMCFLSDYGNKIVNNPENINKRNLRALGVSLDEVYSTPKSLRNNSYLSYMLRIAYEGGAAETLAAVMPCAVSYLLIARKMIEQKPDCVNNEMFNDFITFYASEGFEKDVYGLINRIDKLAENYSEDRINHLIEIFVIGSKYEKLFWDLSWEMD